MDMEQALREITQVELMYDDGTKHLMFLDAFHIDTQELLELREEGLAQILQRASALLPGHNVLRLSYKDDEADWCTINKASLRDALIFASLTAVNDCGVLPLRVTTDRTPPAGAASGEVKDADLEPPASQPIPVQAGTEDRKDGWMLELHVNVICDGCNANPLMGKRFKSLDHDNYDLCETCFHREPRVPNRWVRVQSDKLQKVAACSGPDTSAHATWVVQCDGCGVVPIEGPRFRCLDLPDYDLCSSCYSKTLSQPASALRFVQVDDPAGCVGEQPKPKVEEEVEEDLESQRVGGDGLKQSLRPLGDIAEESRAIEELEAQRAQLPDKSALYVAELKATIEHEFSAVEPALKRAREALRGLRRVTLQYIISPDLCTKLALEAAVIMVKPDLGMPPPWAAVCKAMGCPNFIQSMVAFEAGTLTDLARQFIRRTYLEHPYWNEAMMVSEGVSAAALPFFLFVASQMEFASVLQQLEPLRDELRRLERQADEAAKDSEAQEQTKALPEPVDLENPLLPVSPAPAEEYQQPLHADDLGDLRSSVDHWYSTMTNDMAIMALRSAMVQLLDHAEPSIRSAAIQALYNAKEVAAEMQSWEAMPETQEHEADTTSTADTSASTSNGVPEAVTVSATEACSSASVRKAVTVSATEACSSASVRKVSARVVSAPPLVLGIEAEELDGLRGDVTDKKPELMASNGTSQVFRMGHIVVPAGNDIPAVPACARLVIVNDGTEPWPDTAAVAHVSGDDMDFPSMPLGSIEPGGGCEVSVELLVPPSAGPKTAWSTWAVLDEASGAGLGPVLLFEVQWTREVKT